MIYPLVVDLWVPELVNAVDVLDCFLVELFLVEEPGTRVVGQLTKEVLGFVWGAS